jgi:hypothetical protein
MLGLEIGQRLDERQRGFRNPLYLRLHQNGGQLEGGRGATPPPLLPPLRGTPGRGLAALTVFQGLDVKIRGIGPSRGRPLKVGLAGNSH